MKKILLSSYIVLSSTLLVAESFPDSTQILDSINTVGLVVSQVAPPQYSKLVVVVTGALSAITSLIIALIHRRKTIKKWERDGKLITKETDI